MTHRTIGDELVQAIADQDWERLQACFAPQVHIRALTPKGIRERSGAAETAALFQGWFGDADPLELLDSQSEQIGDRLHVAYRFHSFEEGTLYVVEQHLYSVVGGQGIESADLLCSGFHPAAES